MNLTNRHNLPASIVRAVERDPYTRGKAAISVTEVIDSPRVRALRYTHDEDIEEDVADQIFSLLGRAVHNIIELGAEEGSIAEERLYLDVEGVTISGAMDLQEIRPGGVAVLDWKVTTVSSFLADKADWSRQLNLYAHLVREVKGLDVVELQIGCFMRDWTARRAGDGSNYPPAPIQMRTLPLWPAAQAKAYLHERVKLHLKAQSDAFANPHRLIECTPEERWEMPTKYALIKKGGVRAKTVFDDEAEAKKALDIAGAKDYEIQTRPGEAKRCASWCAASRWCSQYARETQSLREGAA